MLMVGCNNHSTNYNKQSHNNSITSIDSLRQHLSIQFNNFQQIDSSAYLFFPLAIQVKTDTKGNVGNYFDSYDYSRGDEVYFWNILFHNTETGTSHLLHDSLKIIILNYSLSKDLSYEQETFNNFIFYDVISKDFNNDTMLDEKDPTSLFVSDKQGQTFRQISPLNYDVQTWRLLKQQDKIIMLAVEDTNDDKIFDEKDAIIPFQFDLKSTQSVKIIFDPIMTKQLKQQFLKNWQLSK